MSGFKRTFQKTLILCFLSSITIGLTGCGLSPVYGTHSASSNENVRNIMSNTYIDIIPDRSGVALRNHLIDRFYTSGTPNNPQYILQVTAIQNKQDNLDITETADSTRVQIRLQTNIKLVDAQTNEVLTDQRILSITSYNVLASEFATRVSRQRTEDNAIMDLAKQIETRVSLYLAAL